VLANSLAPVVCMEKISSWIKQILEHLHNVRPLLYAANIEYLLPELSMMINSQSTPMVSRIFFSNASEMVGRVEQMTIEIMAYI